MNDYLVDVRGVDARSIVEPLFLEEDRHRVHLLARRAPGVPDPDEGIRAHERHDLLPDRHVERRIAKHRGDVDGQVQQELLHHCGLMQYTLLQRRDRLEPFGLDPTPEAATDRRIGVRPKVEAVLSEDRLEEYL